MAETIVVDADEVEEAPAHLSDAEAASFPLAGLTAWRALFVKSGNAVEGRNILVTGIGGGVALFVLQFAVARGCRVWVTSGSEEKIQRAVELGAQGGVNYKEAGWEKKLKGMLPKERNWIDAVVDGAGGEVVGKGSKLLKVCFLLLFKSISPLCRCESLSSFLSLSHMASPQTFSKSITNSPPRPEASYPSTA